MIYISTKLSLYLIDMWIILWENTAVLIPNLMKNMYLIPMPAGISIWKRKGSISRKSQLQKLEPSVQQQQNTTNLQGEPQHLSVILLPIHLLQQQTAKSLLTAVFSSAPPPSSPHLSASSSCFLSTHQKAHLSPFLNFPFFSPLPPEEKDQEIYICIYK